MSRALAALLGMAAAAAQAQDAFDPDFALDEAPPAAWQPFHDLRLRGDHVQGLPDGRADLDRLRLRARSGLRFDAGGPWTAGVAVEAALGSDANRDRVIHNDLERSDDINLDQAWLGWQASDRLHLQAGKLPLPIASSPLVWDADLRPIGIAATLAGEPGQTTRWQLQAGGFAPDPLEVGGARVAVVQAAWHWNEGARWSGSARLTQLRFSRTDTLARAGLGRGNLLSGGRYVHDYRPVDLQLQLRRNDEQWPLLAGIELLRNPGADTQRDGARATVVAGDRRRPGAWEFGWAWERLQRDATLAAVTDDDWWFHARMRGHGAWIGAGLDGTWSWRLSGFAETRDAPRERTRRVLLDLDARW